MKCITFIVFGLMAMLCSTPSLAQAPDANTGASTNASEQHSFLLGSGDRLKITVYGEQKLSGEYAVTSGGYISFPLIGNVAVEGRTLEQVQEDMRNSLASGYLQDPRVSIEVQNYRPFYILGEVEKPGEYPYVSGLTLEQAIAKAGGYTYRAKKKKILIKGANQLTEQSFAYRDKKILVKPGDTIRVPERFF